MVIAEALVRAIPVITTDIAGIPEMLDGGGGGPGGGGGGDQQEGFVLPEGDEAAFVGAMRRVATEPGLRRALGEAGLARGRRQFGMSVMCAQYAAVCRRIAPPTVLIDMDGVVVDWDAGFAKCWREKAAANTDPAKTYSLDRTVRSLLSGLLLLLTCCTH